VDQRRALQIARELLREDGLRGMYSGVFSPCISVGAWKGAVLGTHHQLLSLVAKRRHLKKEELPMLDVTLCACLAGATGAAACSPFEMIKSRAQLGAGEALASGGGQRGAGLVLRELREVSQLVRADGAAGLTRGLPLLFMRDFPATGVFLGTYEALFRHLKSDRGWPTTASALVSGVISGPIGWVSCYPVEMVRIFYQGGRSDSYLGCVREIYRQSGAAGFFRGLPTCCARSAFQIGGTMAVFEQLRALGSGA